jgi:hypothetical protein
VLIRRSTLVILSSALVACKMVNPAFEGGEETAADVGDEVGSTLGEATGGDAEAGSDTTAESSTSDSTDSTDSAETDSGESVGDGDGFDGGEEFGDGDSEESDAGDGDGDSCDLPFTEPLHFKFHNLAAVNNCPEFVSLDMRVSGPGALGGIELQECSEGCGTCFGEPIEVEAYPAQLTDIAEMTLDECLRVNLEVHLGSTSTYCEYGRLAIGYQADPGLMTPLVVASSVDADDNTPVAGFLETAGLLPWVFNIDQQCICPKDNSDPCCLNEDPPRTYKLTAGDVTVSPEESVPFSLLQIPYEFSLWQAQIEDSCGAEFETSWMIRPQ